MVYFNEDFLSVGKYGSKADVGQYSRIMSFGLPTPGLEQ